MRSINSPFTSLPDDDMLLVLRPERGYFNVDTIKRWAADTLFVEEGVITLPERLSIEEAIDILHRYDFARIKR